MTATRGTWSVRCRAGFAVLAEIGQKAALPVGSTTDNEDRDGDPGEAQAAVV